MTLLKLCSPATRPGHSLSRLLLPLLLLAALLAGCENSDHLQAIKAGVMQNLFIPELPSPEEIAQLEEKEKQLQHMREAAAKEVHESMDAGPPESEQGSMEGLNRKARRLQQQAQQRGHETGPRKTDYSAAAAQHIVNAPGSRARRSPRPVGRRTPARG